ncbi:MAG: hypothetical protein RLZZ450_6211 [Pseudomonadota bacterium]|jgi:AraC-like DNA-binding protein
MLSLVDRSTDMPENVLSRSSSQRSWNGVSVEVAEFRCAGRVVHRLQHDTETRLNVLLEEVGSHCEPRLRPSQPCPVGYTPRHMHFAPAGMPVWGFSADSRFVHDATLILDLETLGERLATNFDPAMTRTPRLRFSDERIWTLVKLLSSAVTGVDPASQLYGDGLITAVVALLFGATTEPAPGGAGLAPWQLRRVVDYLEAHLSERIELVQLATMVGLSQSHFSRAFKASTGTAPYRWQLDARIRRAQALLMSTHASLAQVADATGFADAVHFGRTFRKLTGATPGAWRRDRQR